MARKTHVIPSGFGVLHILIYDLPICFDTVSEKTNRQHDAFGIELRKRSLISFSLRGPVSPWQKSSTARLKNNFTFR